MGREARKVPKNWKHPKDNNGRYIPLYEGSGFLYNFKEWHKHHEKWEEGLVWDYLKDSFKPKGIEHSCSFEEWYDEKPNPADYMPDWIDEARTHYQMYETCSEGTPISPVMETPEELAKWLADNNASSFGDMTASYEQWSRLIKSGKESVGLVMVENTLMSGVEYEKKWFNENEED